MTTSPLAPGAYVLLEGPGLRKEAQLAAVTANGLRITQPVAVPESRDAAAAEESVSWTALRRVSVRRPRPRNWSVPVGLGALGALGMGSFFAVLGFWLSPPFAALEIGFLLGALVGCVAIFSRSRSRWEVVYEAAPGAASDDVHEPAAPRADVPTSVSLSERVEQGAREAASTAERTRVHRVKESALAWILFGVLVVGVYGWCVAAGRRLAAP